MPKKPKDKPICFFCGKPVDVSKIYYIITGPDGQEAMVHDHTGVKEHGVKMWKGRVVREDN